MTSTKIDLTSLTLEQRILRVAERRLHRFLPTALPHIHKSDLDFIVFKHARDLAKEVMDEMGSFFDDYADKLTASHTGRRTPQGGRGKS